MKAKCDVCKKLIEFRRDKRGWLRPKRQAMQFTGELKTAYFCSKECLKEKVVEVLEKYCELYTYQILNAITDSWGCGYIPNEVEKLRRRLLALEKDGVIRRSYAPRGWWEPRITWVLSARKASHEIIGESKFNEFLEKFNRVVIDFYADWCPPCKALAPIFEQLAEKYSKYGIAFARVNVDKNSKLADKLSIMAVPTLIFFKKGKELFRRVGFLNRKELEECIKGLLA